MLCSGNRRPRGAIIFWSPEDDDIIALQRHVAVELIRFGQTTPKFHTYDLIQHKVLCVLPEASLYLKNGEPWHYPYNKVIGQFPNLTIKVHYSGTNSPEWNSVIYGNATPEACSIFAQLEELLVQDPGLPLKQFATEAEEDKESVEVDPAEERRENTEKIKGLIRDSQETLALQLVRSLADPQIYSELLKDCCEIREEEGWIQTSELFEGHDALFYQLLAHAPEEANLPGPLRQESIKHIHLNNCSSISNLDFLRHFPRLESFAIWGWGEDAANLSDISGLEGLTRLKSLQLNCLKSSPDWTPLQRLVQLRDLTLSGEELVQPEPEVFSRLSKLKELSIACNGVSEMRGLSGLRQLSSLTLNEAKSLGSLSFLDSLRSLRSLGINGYGGDSLKGIGKCNKITEFSISDAGKLEDISELSSLSRLRKLTLSGKFQNLDPLRSLASLQAIYIHDAEKLRDVSGLGKCLGLERINMYGVSSLGSLWGIGQLNGLQELSISSWENTPGCMDIHEIGGLANLRDLNISCSGRILRGFPAVRHLKKLRSLDVSGCYCERVTDLSPLRKLKMLNSLKMGNCQSVTNLDGLSNLHRLEILELTNFPRLASLSGLRDIDHLQQLTITGSGEIEGLDDLANLRGLTHLALRFFSKLRDASSIYGMTQLEALDLEGAGRLSDISFLDSLEDLNSLNLSCCYRIHPDDFMHLYEDDFETLCLPDTDEYEEDECEEEDERMPPWGWRNLDDIPDDEWLRRYDKDTGPGLLQKAVGEGWLDRVPEHILTNENLLAVEAIHIAAINRYFGQLPSSLFTAENLLVEDVDQFWNVFHFAAAYNSLDLLPDHLLTGKNLLVPTRVDWPSHEDIFAGSNCLHIAAARGFLTLLPRFLLTPQNLLLKDERGNTALDQAEAWLQTNQDIINDLKENDGDQNEIASNEDWLETAQIQIAHLRQQVAEAEIPEEAVVENEFPEEPEVGAEVTESDEKQDEPLFDSDSENGPISEPELAVAGDDDLATDSEALAEQDEAELESEPVQEDIDTADSSGHLTEQTEPVEQDRQNGQTVGLFDDVMLDAEEEVAEMPNGLKSEPVQEDIDTADESSHPTEQTEPVVQDQHNDQAVGMIEEVMSNDEAEDEQTGPLQKLSITELSLDDQPAPQEEEPVHKMNITELSLDNQPATQEAEVPEEALAEEEALEEPVAEEPVAEEVVAKARISPLVMNTWFHSLDEAIDHPRAVVKLDIIRQESLDRLNELSDFPHLEELHFIKVNIDSFEGLNSIPKLCHIKFESCEISGWIGLLDLKGLKKIGCYPEFPPEEVKRLLEEEEVEIYLFTPTRVNETEASGVLPSSSKIQMNHEEAFAQ